MQCIVAIYPSDANSRHIALDIALDIALATTAGGPRNGPVDPGRRRVERPGCRAPTPDPERTETSTVAGKRRAEGTATTRPRSSSPGSPKRRTVRERVGRAVLVLLALGLVGTLLAVLAFVVAYRSIDIPDPNEDFLTETSFVYYADGESVVGEFATQDRVSIDYDDMPESVRTAVVAAEDQSFWTNQGIDPRGILRAAFNNAQGNATQGASTITQQYVKILYLTQERTLKRKLKEAILSLKVQRSQTKRQVLEGYLNTIYFGRGAYGVQAAAQSYFRRDAVDLTLRQSAVLASVINNPSQFDPANGRDNRRALKERYDYTLENMASAGDITADAARQAEKRLPKLPEIAEDDAYGAQRGHMLSLVRSELESLGFSESEIDGQGLRVTTTLTEQAMNAARDGVFEARPEGFSDKELHVAVASVEPGTGALRGFYGGQNYLDSQINWASAGGMIGSTMKPVTLATALEAGFSLTDTFQGNSPYEFPDGLRVQNEGPGEGNDYGEAVTATSALEESVNTAFVDMSNRIPDGPQQIHDTAERMGIPPDSASDRFPGIPSVSRDFSPDDTLITLGRARVSAINMANAYATLANRGQRADVHVVESVTDANGEELYSFKASTDEAISEPIADDVSYAAQQVVNNGTGQTVLGLDRPAAGKTGTATNDKDQVSSAWFVGYTPQLATAVMYVRGDGDDQLDGWLPSYFGSAFPADTWLAVMSRALEGTDVMEFPPPANVDGEAPGEDTTTAPVAPTTTEQAPEPAPTPSQTQQQPRPTPRPTSAPPTTQAPTTAPPTTRAPTSEPPTSAPPTTATPTAPPSPAPTTRGPTRGPSPSGGAGANPVAPAVEPRRTR